MQQWTFLYCRAFCPVQLLVWWIFRLDGIFCLCGSLVLDIQARWNLLASGIFRLVIYSGLVGCSCLDLLSHWTFFVANRMTD